MDIYYYADEACTRPDPAGLFWRGAKNVDGSAASVAVANAWVRWSAMYGPSTFKIVAWSKTGPIGEAKYDLDYWLLPGATRKFTAEGERQHPGAIISVDLLLQAK